MKTQFHTCAQAKGHDKIDLNKFVQKECRKMAHIKFNCPQCGQKIEADDSVCGKVAECPLCGKGIVIPRTTTSVSALPPPKTTKVNCPYCETEYEVSEDNIGHKANCEKCGRKFVIKQAMQTMVESKHETESKHKKRVEQPSETEQRDNESEHTYICTKCGAIVVRPELVDTIFSCGNVLFIVLFLFVCMLVALVSAFLALVLFIGLVLVIVIRMGILSAHPTSPMRRCPNCGPTDSLIPITSPAGKNLLNQLEQDKKHNPPQIDVSERLKKLQALRDSEMISAEEYEAQRNRILESL